jgi:hypothetical protein
MLRLFLTINWLHLLHTQAATLSATLSVRKLYILKVHLITVKTDDFSSYRSKLNLVGRYF